MTNKKTTTGRMFRFSLYDKAAKSRGSVEATDIKTARKLIVDNLRNGTPIPEGWSVVNRGPVVASATETLAEGIGLQHNVKISRPVPGTEDPTPKKAKGASIQKLSADIPEPTYMMTEDFIMMIHQGKPLNIHRSSQHYDTMRDAIEKKEWIRLGSIADVAAFINSQGIHGVRIDNGIITYKGDMVHNVLADRILAAAKRGESVAPMIKFLENLLENPIESAIAELYLFMEKNDLPLTDDGCFLAYKRVNGEYMDCHSRSIPNHVGNIIEMDRAKCDTNRENVCSRGLHFCSRSYLGSFSGDRTVIVKIDPRDVVAIPSDYANAKGRCCRYTVVDELRAGHTNSPAIPKKYQTGGVVGKHVFAVDGEYEDFSKDKSTEDEKAFHTKDVAKKLDSTGLSPKVAKFVDDIREKLTADGGDISPNIIRMVRIYRKLSVLEVADACGIGESAYRKRESVSNNPKTETVEATVATIMRMSK